MLFVKVSDKAEDYYILNEITHYMIENESVLEQLCRTPNLSCTLLVDSKIYQNNSMSIVRSTIPVREPTTRGGVYFTDVTAYKIKLSTTDISIKGEIPKLMLGPNTDFKPVVVKTILDAKNIMMHCHLTNAVNTKDRIDLNLIVDKVAIT